MKSIIVSIICGIIIFIVGMSLMPQAGGTVAQGQTIEQYNDEQRQIIIKSDGFKISIAGALTTVLSICLLIYFKVREDAKYDKERRVQVAPEEILVKPIAMAIAPMAMAPMAPRAPMAPMAPRAPMAIAPRVNVPITMPRQPRQPIFYELRPPRTFRYPPPYESFNKK